MQGFVAYYRVSTDRQGQSGLGLDAQRAAVAGFIGTRGLVAEFTEVESGKRSDRPQLAMALDLCRRKRTMLVIAKLDRLARNVAFIANLMESGVEFVAVDMPYANKLTLHILAAVAEHEREMISVRTKIALAAYKARGGKKPRAAKLAVGRRAVRGRRGRRQDCGGSGTLAFWRCFKRARVSRHLARSTAARSWALIGARRVSVAARTEPRTTRLGEATLRPVVRRSW